tara:strand:+ start:753 stop:1511 length:759 start_codon:yes stop_codon:yes gene_type:complete
MIEKIEFYNKNTIVILPHLDDEFALTPLLNNIDNLTIIYCSERLEDTLIKQNNRRNENIKSLQTFGIGIENIIYLNDNFLVNDLELVSSSVKIYEFILNYITKSRQRISQIITLNLEGGHPDHDAVALIVSKIAAKLSIKPIYIPAYNNRKTLYFFPISVFRPLKSQEKYFSEIKLNNFSWFNSIKVSLIYKSEINAFIKLFPFILFQFLFSKSIYVSNIIDLDSVNWNNNFTKKRYNSDIKIIMREIDKIQ